MAFFTDTTTVAERWLLVGALFVVVMGALVQHFRSRPQPLSAPAAALVAEP